MPRVTSPFFAPFGISTGRLQLGIQVRGQRLQLLERRLPAGLELLQLVLELLDLVAGQDAGVVLVLVVLVVGGGEQRVELGEAGALGLHLGEHLGELALEDVLRRG